MVEFTLNRDKLIDKLAERWLFEKKTVTLYDKVTSKLKRMGFDDRAVRQLQGFRDQEKQHQTLLEQYLRQLGASTRRRTPSQMLVERHSKAFENIISETDEPLHPLHVMLDAEMEDNASWNLLIQLARKAGQVDFVDTFAQALEQENQQLRGIRTLVSRRAREELIEQQPSA